MADDHYKTTPVSVPGALRHVARDALADDGIMTVHATHVLDLLDENERLTKHEAEERGRQLAKEATDAR